MVLHILGTAGEEAAVALGSHDFDVVGVLGKGGFGFVLDARCRRRYVDRGETRHHGSSWADRESPDLFTPLTILLLPSPLMQRCQCGDKVPEQG
jgi:hypothetical protein